MPSGGLWRYLRENPELMAGEDELAVELRRFCQDMTLGRLSFDYIPAHAEGQRDPRGGSVDRLRGAAAALDAFAVPLDRGRRLFRDD
ncbi:hypothetical protein GCM10008966_10740 [Rhodovulum strictum]